MDFCQILECQSPCTNVKTPIADLLAMVLLVTNKGKEYHDARCIGRGPTARPSAQVTMKTESQRFSTIAGLNLFKIFFQSGSSH